MCLFIFQWRIQFRWKNHFTVVAITNTSSPIVYNAVYCQYYKIKFHVYHWLHNPHMLKGRAEWTSLRRRLSNYSTSAEGLSWSYSLFQVKRYYIMFKRLENSTTRPWHETSNLQLSSQRFEKVYDHRYLVKIKVDYILAIATVCVRMRWVKKHSFLVRQFVKHLWLLY